MIKWFKQFDDFKEEELPWVINGCIPGDSYLHYIEAQIDKLKQYYDNLLEEVQLMNVTAKETFYKLLETYDYYEIQPHDFQSRNDITNFYMLHQNKQGNL